jgi:Arylsulfotransferase (ASST)
MSTNSCVTHRRIGSAVPAIFAAAALAAAGLGGLASPAAAATSASTTTAPTISAQPALTPAFDPSIHNYVTRCEPAETVGVSVSTPAGEPVSVDGHAAQTGSFLSNVALATGQRFTIQTGTGTGVQTYNVRCLPVDFPGYTAERFSQPQAAYFLTTPSLSIASSTTPYVVLFDDNGVPIWWYRSTDGIPLNPQLLNDGNLSWNLETTTPAGFGTSWGDHLEERTLTGSLVNTYRTWFTPTDFHESVQEPNGDFLMTSFVLTQGENLWSLGIPWPVTVLNASFQEITPSGVPDFTWNSQGHLSPSESLDWWSALFQYPGQSQLGMVWDWQHINSVAPDGSGYFLVSMRHTNAVYLIRRSDGSVVWKLGGSTTPQSLKIIGDPDAANDFGGQHDARVLPDGTISVHDNGTGQNRPPRVLRFRIDTQARTATLLSVITDPDIKASPCCGSARLLPGGDWVVDWGGTGRVEELTASSQPVWRVDFAAPLFSYRAVPILPGRLSDSALIAGMDAMYPRP